MMLRVPTWCGGHRAHVASRAIAGGQRRPASTSKKPARNAELEALKAQFSKKPRHRAVGMSKDKQVPSLPHLDFFFERKDASKKKGGKSTKKKATAAEPEKKTKKVKPDNWNVWTRKHSRRPALHLIDTGDLIFRNFFAIPLSVEVDACHPNAKLHGKPINAATGFARGVIKHMEVLQPGDMIAFGFDIGPTWRHDTGCDYKGGRKKREGLSHQFQICYDLAVDMLGERHCFRLPRMEADDVLAHLAEAAKAQGVEVVTYSQDQDMLQLAQDKAHPLRQVRKFRQEGAKVEIGVMGVDEIRNSFDLEPSQLVDYWALYGQAADNIEGMPGVGKVTAMKLVKEYRSLDKLLKAPYTKLAEKFGPKVAANVTSKEGRDSALFAREMMQLACHKTLREGRAHAKKHGQPVVDLSDLTQLVFRGPRVETGRAHLERFGWASHVKQLEQVGKWWTVDDEAAPHIQVVQVGGQAKKKAMAC